MLTNADRESVRRLVSAREYGDHRTHKQVNPVDTTPVVCGKCFARPLESPDGIGYLGFYTVGKWYPTKCGFNTGGKHSPSVYGKCPDCGMKPFDPKDLEPLPCIRGDHETQRYPLRCPNCKGHFTLEQAKTPHLCPDGWGGYHMSPLGFYHPDAAKLYVQAGRDGTVEKVVRPRRVRLQRSMAYFLNEQLDRPHGINGDGVEYQSLADRLKNFREKRR